MNEHQQNAYRGLEVSALAKEGQAFEARRQAEGLIQQAERYEAQALELRSEMGRIAGQLTQEEQHEDR